jgi:hypothetical protein
MADVRKLGPGDEAVVQELSRWVDRPPHDDAGAARFLANERNHLLVAFDGKEPVGMVLAHELDLGTATSGRCSCTRSTSAKTGDAGESDGR